MIRAPCVLPSNEKYAGDLLLQKAFVADHITKEVKKNKGEMPQLIIQDDHQWNLLSAPNKHIVLELIRSLNKE